MRYGIAFANIGPFVDPDAPVSLAQAAESAGFESLWTVDHVVVPAGYRSAYPYDASGRMPSAEGEQASFPDPLIWMTWVAAATTSLRLATGILILPLRNPLVLAKQVASLDRLSRGRVALGVGIGWLEEEFQALSIPFRNRAPRTEDAIGAMRALWSEDFAGYDSPTVSFRDCCLRPQPETGAIPVHVGGHSRAAAQRAGRIGDGFFPLGVAVDDLPPLLDRMRAGAEEVGHDPGAIEVTVAANMIGPQGVEEAAAYERAGATRIVVPAAFFRNDIGGGIAGYAKEVIGRA